MNADRMSLSLFLWVGGLFALLVTPVLVFPFLGLGDYGRHLATAFILKRLLVGDLFYASYFELNPIVQPYILSQLLLVALSYIGDIELAGRLLLIIFILLMPLCAYLYEKTVTGQSPVWWPLSLCLIYTWHFNMGFLPYLLGIPLVLITLTYFIGKTPISSMKEAGISALLLMGCFLCHIFAFAVAFLFVTIISCHFLTKGVRYAINYMISVIPSLILLSNYLLHMMTNRADLSAITFSSIPDIIKHYFYYNFISYSKPLGFIIGFFFTVVFCTYLIRNYKSFWRLFQKPGRIKERGMFIAWLILLFLCISTPYRIGPLFFSNSRLVPFLLLIGIPFLRRIKINYILFIASIIVFCQFFITLHSYSIINSRYQAVAKTLPLMEPHSEFMPLVADKTIDTVSTEPYSYFWVYYLIRKSSVSPCLPAGSPARAVTNSPLIYKSLYNKSPGLWPLDRMRAKELIKEQVYEYVMIWKAPDESESVLLNAMEKHCQIIYQSEVLIIGKTLSRTKDMLFSD